MQTESTVPRETSEGFSSELRISPRPAIILLAACGFVVFALSGIPFAMGDRMHLLLFSVLLFVLAAGAWRLDRWVSWAGRWFTVVAWIAVIHIAGFWLGFPGSLTLAALPTALAAALISLVGAGVTALGQTVLVLALATFVDSGVTAPTVAAAVIAVWATLGVMFAVYVPVQRVARWAWEYFQQAHTLLQEARDRRAELEQVLEDLADANVQLTRMNVLAQGLRQVAEDARLAKEQFVANVSHELRTPLNMITGFSEMILQAPETYGEGIPSALLADLAVIHRNAEHLSALIDDVLDLSQVETGQMALTKERVRFSEVVETAALAVRPLFTSKGLYLRTEVPADLPPIFCDRTRIREVLLNLLSNAGRFTEEGGVAMRCWVEAGELTVSIADTGHGIAAEDISKLFQPFQQLDGSIRRRYGGTGLGLAISKRFVELHGGKIWVESEPDVGTVFFFQLPLTPPTPIDTEDSWRKLKPEWEFFERTRPWKAPQRPVRPRYVVLESGDALQRLLVRYLDGVEVVHADTLDAALAELARVPAQTLLINEVSVGKGLDRLMATTLPNGIPALICSVPGEAASLDGVAERLVKPVSREALLTTLDGLGVAEGTVLIVDDEPDALQLFGRMLASSGRAYRVLLARDGQEALHVLEECRPDVILLDLVMPTMDGFQVLDARHEMATLRDIPVVVISARDPMGQPIVSDALAVTQGGGVSVQRLLLSISFVSRAFSVTAPADAPAPSATPRD